MPLRKLREKVVYGLAKKRRGVHRYTPWRWGVAIAFTLAIAALPAFGWLRFDLWGGHHEYLGHELGLVEVAKRFAFPFLAINLLILVVSRFFGRYLCGFVCPYGAVARFAEWLRQRTRSKRDRILGIASLLGVCALLSAITFSFWVDWRVFRDGSSLAMSIAGMFLLGMVSSFYVFATRLGLGFCRDWCPSGVYFALLGPETTNGVEFAHPETCIECDVCDKACPMDLPPREMASGEPRAATGLYLEGLSHFALCIRCGDCIAACEAMTAKKKGPTPLRMGPLHVRAPFQDEVGAITRDGRTP